MVKLFRLPPNSVSSIYLTLIGCRPLVSNRRRSIPGLIMHGLKPLFLKHRWELHLLLAEIGAALTPFLLLAQYAMLSIERTEFFYSDVIVWRIVGPGLISLVIAPCVFFILTPLSHMLGYRPGLRLAG
jgi:hypothetical protein